MNQRQAKILGDFLITLNSEDLKHLRHQIDLELGKRRKNDTIN